jgi:hypothetical protein
MSKRSRLGSRASEAGARAFASTCNTPSTLSSRRASASTRAARGKVRPGRRAGCCQAGPGRRKHLDAATARDPHRHAGAVDRATFRGERTNSRAEPDPSAERDRADRPARAHRGRHRQATRATDPLDARTSQRWHRGARRFLGHAGPRIPLTHPRSRRQALPGRTRRACALPRPTLLEEPGVGPISAAKCSPATRHASRTRPHSLAATEPPRSPPPRERRSATASTAVAIARPTTRFTRSRSSAPNTNPKRGPT